MIRDWIPVDLQIVQIMIQLDGWLDRIEDDHIPSPAVQIKTEHNRYATGSWNIRLLQGLEAGELSQRRTTPEKSSKSVARPSLGIEFKVVHVPLVDETPDLAVSPVFDQGCKSR
jgi:hypothetical protein